MKQKFVDAHMAAAEVYSKLSSAKRLQVGCVVVKDNTIIGIGYNGMPSGWDNECEVLIPEQEIVDIESRSITYIEERLVTKSEVLHAETNCLAKIARSTNSSEGASLFVTHAPCLDCAKIIYQAGIKEVYYKHSYRETSGIEFLKKCKIEVIQVQ
jgi:dCMP deaminase